MASHHQAEVKKEINFPLRLLFAGISGMAGATAVYPLDLAKTRLQNQKTSNATAKGVVYSGARDVWVKSVKAEGFTGLYRGWSANMVGIIPEKAIKLSMNDYMRGVFKCDQEFSIFKETMAGAIAGFTQVVVTCPMEVCKINLQVAKPDTSALRLVKNLGFSGLYKDVPATLLRDIPFSMLYFSMYSYCKLQFALHNESKNNSTQTSTTRRNTVPVATLPQVLMSGTIAGTIAASITTPFDVVKTRLQASLGAGEHGHASVAEGQDMVGRIVSCGRKIVQEEGVGALYKGVVPRSLIIAPLFGITMITYEMLQRGYRNYVL